MSNKYELSEEECSPCRQKTKYVKSSIRFHTTCQTQPFSRNESYPISNWFSRKLMFCRMLILWPVKSAWGLVGHKAASP